MLLSLYLKNRGKNNFLPLLFVLFVLILSFDDKDHHFCLVSSLTAGWCFQQLKLQQY